MKRRDHREIGYSPAEEKLLKILLGHKTKAINSVELCEAFYDGNEQRPWHAHSGVNVAMRSLIRKVVHNQEEFVIERTGRRGPYPIEFRLVAKTKKRSLASV